MKSVVIVLASFVALSGAASIASAEAEKKTYNVLEVAPFQVDRDDLSSKESERAGRIPEETLVTIHRILISELSQAQVRPRVRKPAAADDGETVLELEGKVVDWLAGSPVKRYFVGMGAGQQKIEVDCVLKDKSTGAVLGQLRILDRKVAGIGGGSEEKGMRDFAEKVAKFIQTTMEPRSWKAPAVAAAPVAPAAVPAATDQGKTPGSF